MARRQTITLAAFLLFVTVCRAQTLPRWEVVELGLPTSSWSEAVDVNERNEALGVIGPEGAESAFVWSAQGLKILNGFGGGQTLPKDINNVGVVVGGSLSNGVMRAWLWTNGADIDISRGFTNETRAGAINDHGDIAGRVDFPRWYPLLYLLSAPPVQLTHDFGFDTSGPAPGPDLEPRAINNNGFVAARFLGDGVLHTNLAERNVPIWLAPRASTTAFTRTEYEGLALNNSNHVAGYFRHYMSAPQPGVWTGDAWMALGSSTERGTRAKGINDNGVAVGAMDAPATAMIWKEGGAADLNGFVDLPLGARVVDAAAVNNAGYIAATVEENGQRRAVLLRPGKDASIPKLTLNGVTAAVLQTNRLSVSIETDYPATSSRVATFRLHQRFANSYQHGMYMLRVFQTSAVRTNTASGAELATTFSDLAEGVYVLGAELRDTNGVALYSTPVMFAVGGPAAMRAFRVNWSGEFEFGVEAASAQEYELQESADLREWKTVPESVNRGRMFAAAPTNGAAFYRTVVRRYDLDLDALPLSIPRAPTSLGYQQLRVSMAGQVLFDVQISADGTFSGTYGNFQSSFAGTYQYQPRGAEARIVLTDANPPPLVFRLEFEFPSPTQLPFGPGGYVGKARGSMTDGSVTTSVSGTFSMF
jgi:hypothetical protein